MAADLTIVEEIARADNHLAVVAVARPDGSVHASLVRAGSLSDPLDGVLSVGIVVAGNTVKLRHLRRTGRVTVVFKGGRRWASVEGPIDLIGPDDPPTTSTLNIPEVLRNVFKAAGGTHDDWEQFDRVMAEDRRCAVFVHAAKISGNG